MIFFVILFWRLGLTSLFRSLKSFKTEPAVLINFLHGVDNDTSFNFKYPVTLVDKEYSLVDNNIYQFDKIEVRRQPIAP